MVAMMPSLEVLESAAITTKWLMGANMELEDVVLGVTVDNNVATCFNSSVIDFEIHQLEYHLMPGVFVHHIDFILPLTGKFTVM